MTKTVMLVPIEADVCLTNIVTLGIKRALKLKAINLDVFKPFNQIFYNNETLAQKTTVLTKIPTYSVANSLQMNYFEKSLSKNQKNVLIEEIISNYYENIKNAEVVLVESLMPTCEHYFNYLLNFEIALALKAEIIFIIVTNILSNPIQIKKNIELIYNNYSEIKNINITGAIFVELNIPINSQNYICSYLFEVLNKEIPSKKLSKFDPIKFTKLSKIPVLGVIPWDVDLLNLRVKDVINYLNATLINQINTNNRFVKSILFCEKSVSYMLKNFRNDSLIIASMDRIDLLINCLTAINNLRISAILIVGIHEKNSFLNKICSIASSISLPVLIINTNTWQTLLKLEEFSLRSLIKDSDYIENLQKRVARYINTDWVKSSKSFPNVSISKLNHCLSPISFRCQLLELARQASKRIILPEGNEPRTVQAANICAKRGIANCILLGKPDEINFVAKSQGIKLNSNIEIINPEIVRESYIDNLIKIRKNKGMNKELAIKQLEDNVVLGTLMLKQNEVDGLVSGAIHTTANTIRPSLQLIKTTPGISLVSSIFFMLLPEQVYIYGDCAINLNPNANQLAEIAIQSADSAKKFGIYPMVAMLSYSTGTSGSGIDVEKVREATNLVKIKRPDLIIDGPLQYDAAMIPEIAKFKAPNSPIAGNANTFIFPDLDSGNITYKAVQRSANVISIGPMLQGIRKPVNDLSRGASVNDIVYTIALTTIQAT